MTTIQPLLAPERTAEIIGVGVKTLEIWRIRGQGPAFIRAGRSIKYDPRDLDAWIQSRRATSTSQAT